MKRWRSDVGMWYLVKTKHFSITGTTPRNADVFSIDVEIGPVVINPSIGLHDIGLTVWIGESLYGWSAGRMARYAKSLRAPLPPATIEALRKQLA